MTDEPHKPTNEADPSPDSDTASTYEPSYSEPSWDTTSVAPDTDIVEDDATDYASAPDATPLTDTPADTAPGSDDQAPGWPGPDQPPASSTSEDPGHEANRRQERQEQPRVQPSPGEQENWGGAPPQPYQQAYQQSPPPAQPSWGYGGTANATNPDYLVGPTQEGRTTVQLDYWLSVFFSWIPALIFFLIERDKNKLVDDHTKEILNFSLTRVIVGAVAIIPFVGWIIGGIASLVLFIVAIMGAVKGTEEYDNGRPYQFPLTLRLIK